jgi:hypothetical protein
MPRIVCNRHHRGRCPIRQHRFDPRRALAYDLANFHADALGYKRRPRQHERRWVRCYRRRRQRCALMSKAVRFSAFGAISWLFRLPFGPWIRVFPLPKPPDGAILAPQPPGIRGISVKGFIVREASVTEVKASRRRIEPMDSAAFLWLGGDGCVAKAIMNWNSAFHSLVQCL